MSSDDDATTRKPVRRFVLLAVLLGAVIVVAYYFWLQAQAPAPPQAELDLLNEQAGRDAAPRHPLGPADAPNGEPLPAIAESDDALRARGETLIGSRTLERLFHLDTIVRRVVVTIDNLPARRLPQRYSLARSVPGRFRAIEDGDVAYLGDENFARYEPYVKLAQAVDTKDLVAAYMHFYPLFQEEYENLGFRNAYFNDRVVAVIDDLLAAPEIKGRVRLVRPRVMYEFADPELEALSAGQKILLRMGPENAAVIKDKLRELREALTAAR